MNAARAPVLLALAAISALPQAGRAQSAASAAAVQGADGQPAGIRFRAQAFLTFEAAQPIALGMVGYMDAAGRCRLDCVQFLAKDTEAGILTYRHNWAAFWADGALAVVWGSGVHDPSVIRPAAGPGDAEKPIVEGPSDPLFPPLGAYLRSQQVLADWPSWTKAVETIQEGQRAGWTATTYTAPEPIRILEPHTIAALRYYATPEGRLAAAESLGPGGEVVATTEYSEFAALASGETVPLVSRTEMVPGALTVHRTLSSTTIDEEHPEGVTETREVDEQLAWRPRAIERRMQIAEGRYVLPQRTTVLDAEGNVLADIEYLSVEVGSVPEAVFETGEAGG